MHGRGLRRRLKAGDHVCISGPARIWYECAGRLRIECRGKVRARHVASVRRITPSMEKRS